jgi:outer membrane immunogenic protein
MSKVRTQLLLTAALVSLSTSVYAADMGMPMKAAPPPPPLPVFSWTGFYGGGNFGVGLSRNQFSQDAFQSSFFTSASFDPAQFFGITPGTALGTANGLGPLGGFTAGGNWQVPGTPWVFGVEGEFMFSDLKGSSSDSISQAAAITEVPFLDGSLFGFTAFANSSFNEQLSTNVRDIATITGRFGIAAGPGGQTLWYVKGGGAWAKTNWGENFTASGLACAQVSFVVIGGQLGCAAFDANGTANADTSHWGWVVGTGVEWALWNNLSAKIEYEFLDFGGQDLALTGTQNINFGQLGSESSAYTRNIHVDQQIHVVKVGLNYRFNWGSW